MDWIIYPESEGMPSRIGRRIRSPHSQTSRFSPLMQLVISGSYLLEKLAAIRTFQQMEASLAEAGAAGKAHGGWGQR